MNKPDYATQWKAVVARIAHIERLLLAGLAVFGAAVGYFMGYFIQRQVSSPREFWLFTILLTVLTFAYLHLMLILTLHGRHVITIERASTGEFSLFLTIFHRIHPSFYVGYAICTLIPTIVTAGITFLYRDHAHFPIVIYLAFLLSVSLYITVGVIRDLRGIQRQTEDAPIQPLHQKRNPATETNRQD